MRKTFLFCILLILSQTLLHSQTRYKKKRSRNSIEGFGIELPIGIMSSSIDLPLLLQGQIPAVEGGTGIDFGLGVTYENHKNLNLRAGFHVWNSPFKPTVNTNKNDKRDFVIEDGKLTYYGMYTRIEWGNPYFFIGAGLDFSFANTYQADRIYYENNNKTDRENNFSSSVLTDNFNNQVYFKANAGFKIPFKNYIIKPYFAIGAAFTSIYPTPEVKEWSNGFYTIVYDDPQIIDLQYIPTFNYGISVEYKF